MADSSFIKCVRDNLTKTGSFKKVAINKYVDYFNNRIQFHELNSKNHTKSPIDLAKNETIRLLKSDYNFKEATLKNNFRMMKDTLALVNDNIDNIKDSSSGLERLLYSELDFDAGVTNKTSSVKNLQNYYKATIFKANDDILSALKNYWGRRRKNINTTNLLKELMSEETGDKLAKSVAKAFKDSFDKGVDLFNSVGGRMDKYEKNYVPMQYSFDKVFKMSKNDFNDFMIDKVKWDAVSHQDGKPILENERVGFLNDMYDNITTNRGKDSALDYKDGKLSFKKDDAKSAFADYDFGTGNNSKIGDASSRKFLIYKDADSQAQVMAKLTDGDLISNLFDHIHSQSYQIALIDKFGVAPRKGFDLKKKLLKDMATSLEKNNPSEYKGLASRTEAHINSDSGSEAIFNQMYDRTHSAYQLPTKLAYQATGSILRSAQLGATPLIAIPTDIMRMFYTRLSKHGLSIRVIVNGMKGMFEPFGMHSQRDVAEHLGIVSDNYIKGILENGNGRFEYNPMNSNAPKVFSMLPEAVQRVNFQQAHDMSLKNSLLFDNIRYLTAFRNKTFDELKPKLQDTLKRYGIEHTDWDHIRADSSLDKQIKGMINFDNIENKDAAKKFYSYISDMQYQQFIDRPSSRVTAITSKFQGDTPIGALNKSINTYTGFTRTMMSVEKMMINNAKKTYAGRATLWARNTILMAFAATVGIVAKQIASGSNFDLNSLKDPKFWVKALTSGMGFGFIGDTFNSAFSNSQTSHVSPLSDLVTGAIKPASTFTKWLLGQQKNGRLIQFGDVATDSAIFASKVVPFSNVPLVKAFYDRNIVDGIHSLLDPDSYKYFKAKQNRYNKEGGVWWQDNQLLPDTLPQFVN